MKTLIEPYNNQHKVVAQDSTLPHVLFIGNIDDCISFQKEFEDLETKEMDDNEMNDKLDAFDNAVNSMTQEEWDEFNKQFPPPPPKGWLSIEDHLPMCNAMDFITKGYSVFKVRDKDGNEFESGVTDHNTWYYIAKQNGVTHWLNEDKHPEQD